MKIALLALGALAALAGVDAAAESTIRIRVHETKQGAICYKQCPSGQYCARGTTTCRAPKGTSECFNPATSLWIPKCDPGFKCSNGKCVYAKKHKEQTKQGAICYKQCPSGQYCARGTTTCRAPKGTSECFNPATSLWIPKCDPGFKCSNGKCVYAKHKKSVREAEAGSDEEASEEVIEFDFDSSDDSTSGSVDYEIELEIDSSEDGSESEDSTDSSEDSDSSESSDASESEDENSIEVPVPALKKSHSKQGAICYKQCPSGQYCARGTTSCRAPKKGTSECFNPATSLWIAKCDPGFKCSNGKCVYA